MKEKKAFVRFVIKKENSETVYRHIKIDTEELRKAIKNLNEEEMCIIKEKQNNQTTFSIEMKISELKKYIKKAELKTNIVPRFISKYIIDITRKFSQKELAPIEGRTEELEKTWFYLSQKRRNNVFLVGGIDVGKTAIALEIVRQIATNECPKEFSYARVLMFRPEMLFEIQNDFIYMHLLNSILDFLIKNKKRVILYVDNGIYLKYSEDLNLFLQELIKYNIPIISTISEENFEEYFLRDSAIAKYLNYVYVAEPELEEIEPMISRYIVKLKKQYKINISKDMLKFGIFTSVLSNSVSQNPGNVINIFDRAFLEAKRKGKVEIDKQSILNCYPAYLKLYNRITPREKMGIAYHEAGHYVVTIMCNNVKDQKIAFVSILPMMDFLGVNWTYKVPGVTLNYTMQYFLDYIAIFMAGRIAEKLITANESTGASNDLAQANEIAEDMILVYGFSENENSNWKNNRSYVTTEYELKNYLLHDELVCKIDNEIQHFIDKGTEIAEKIIDENKILVQAIAERLLEEEILTGEELSQIVQCCPQLKKD